MCRDAKDKVICNGYPFDVNKFNTVHRIKLLKVSQTNDYFCKSGKVFVYVLE